MVRSSSARRGISAELRGNSNTAKRVRYPKSGPNSLTPQQARPLNEYVSFSQTPATGGGDGEPTLEEVFPGPTVHDPANQVISSEELHSLVACLSSALSDLESSRPVALPRRSLVRGRSPAASTATPKTLDNALQRVKRKVGAHLNLARSAAVAKLIQASRRVARDPSAIRK